MNSRSELINFLAGQARMGETRIAPLNELSEILGVSIASLREQLEVARVMGLVEIKPRKGINLQDYSLGPALKQSIGYAIAVDPDAFYVFSDLRNHIEAAYWHQAVPMLTPEDHLKLAELVSQAQIKLDLHPIQIPHFEHRELHLTIFSRLNNPFVNGILEAFWEFYEAVGFAVYTDSEYLRTVWEYHYKIVESIAQGDYSSSFQFMIDHTNLLQQRKKSNISQLFE
jgi:DNA-binding FadR family transcriptional regulator